MAGRLGSITSKMFDMCLQQHQHGASDRRASSWYEASRARRNCQNRSSMSMSAHHSMPIRHSTLKCRLRPEVMATLQVSERAMHSADLTCSTGRRLREHREAAVPGC